MKAVEYSRDATKTLLRMDRATAQRIRGKVAQLAAETDSLANNVRALRGGDGLMRLRVGDWRVIYTEDMQVLLVVRVAPRGGAYD
jgi:mRNA interferase RelE/StbE